MLRFVSALNTVVSSFSDSAVRPGKGMYGMPGVGIVGMEAMAGVGTVVMLLDKVVSCAVQSQKAEAVGLCPSGPHGTAEQTQLQRNAFH